MTQQDARPEVREVTPDKCEHTVLTPHWDREEDMGKPEAATFACDACGSQFSYAQVDAMSNQPSPEALVEGHAPQIYDDGKGQ